MIHETSLLQKGAMQPRSGDGPIALIKVIVATVRKRAMPLAIWVVACLLVSFIGASMLPPVYSSAAKLIIESPPQTRGIEGEVVNSFNIDLPRVDSELQLIRSERLQRLVFDSLGLAQNAELEVAPATEAPSADKNPATAPAPMVTPSVLQNEQYRLREIAFARFQDRFDARRVGQSYVIEIVYSSADPVLATRVANSAASAYLLQSVVFKAAAATRGSEFVQGRLDALSAQVDAAEAAVRGGTLPEIQITDAGARIIGAATVPLSPSGPRVKLIAALGGMLGLMSGLFTIALGSALDSRVGDGSALVKDSDLAVLGRLPRMQDVQDLPAAMMSMPENAAYVRALRDLQTATSLAFGPEGRNRTRCIALVSWSAGTGCSTLCMNLAYAMSRSNRDVTVIDTDLLGDTRNLTARYPTGPVGQKSADPMRVEVNGVHLLTTPMLQPLSDFIADPRDPRMAEIFSLARTSGDVVIDLAPMSESADAQALVRYADAVILVATPRTQLEDIALAEHHLRSVGANLVGIAINDPAKTDRFSWVR